MNEYDNEVFFEKYAQMERSKRGLQGAGEWYMLEHMLPCLKNKAFLDLGCGYGWHVDYALKQGAGRALGIDISRKMLEKAGTLVPGGRFRLCSIEDYEYPENAWDCVLSNLVLHYIKDIENIYRLVFRTLRKGGEFVFNIEHPCFTAGINEDWIYDENGKALYWPIDGYFYPGERETDFLGCNVLKQHHTLEQILGELLSAGFKLLDIKEARPSEKDMEFMKDEMRRPMMLLVRAGKE